MVETRPIAVEPELRERLLDRLGLALDAARTARRLRDEAPTELELRGLSHAELEWIHTYLRAQGASFATEMPAGAPVPGRDNVVWLGARPKGRRNPHSKASLAK
ncbi:hypothetical protein [Pseudomonas sp. NPDC007930]|uniref:hypothetical protein n=1 Tax=Pseudomonas sp. NPDC007930 TaxID=3364417 RepID=UPI0036E71312